MGAVQPGITLRTEPSGFLSGAFDPCLRVVHRSKFEAGTLVRFERACNAFRFLTILLGRRVRGLVSLVIRRFSFPLLLEVFIAVISTGFLGVVVFTPSSFLVSLSSFLSASVSF